MRSDWRFGAIVMAAESGCMRKASRQEELAGGYMILLASVGEWSAIKGDLHAISWRFPGGSWRNMEI